MVKIGYLTLIQSYVFNFEEKIIKRGKKCQLWQLHPVLWQVHLVPMAQGAIHHF